MLRLLAGSLLLTLVVFIATVHGQDADEVAVRKVIKTIEKAVSNEDLGLLLVQYSDDAIIDSKVAQGKVNKQKFAEITAAQFKAHAIVLIQYRDLRVTVADPTHATVLGTIYVTVSPIGASSGYTSGGSRSVTDSGWSSRPTSSRDPGRAMIPLQKTPLRALGADGHDSRGSALFLCRPSPNGTGTMILYRCPVCEKLRRHLYRLAASGGRLVDYFGLQCQACARLRWASQGRYRDKPGRTLFGVLAAIYGQPVRATVPRFPWDPRAVSEPRMVVDEFPDDLIEAGREGRDRPAAPRDRAVELAEELGAA